MLAGQPCYVTAWDDLPQAGGAVLGVVGPWVTLQDTTRIDGDDRLEGTLGASSVGASHLTVGTVLQVTTPDGGVREWIIATVRDDLAPDRLSVTALGARVWLAERVIVRDGTTLTFTGSGTLSAVLTTLTGTDEWPAWVVAGTIDRNPTISYTWTATNALAALVAMASAADGTDTVALEGETMRLVFRRVSATQYAVDFLTSAVTGSPTLIEGKNLSSFAVRDDRTQDLTAIYPRNADGVTIAEAMFAVRTVSTNTFDVRDWAYRPDFLAIAYDGQWEGYYAVAPNGTTSLITDSNAATQQITVASATAWGTGNNATVRFSPTSGGTPTVAVVDTAASARRRSQVQSLAFSADINWVPNSRWDEWSSSTVVRDWTKTGGGTIAQVTGASNVETGAISLEYTTGGTTGALTVSEVLMPDEVVTNGGGTQTWRVGIRYRRTANTGGSLAFERSVNGGSSWTSMTNLGSSATFVTYETTFTTTSAILPNRPRLRLASTAVAGTVWVIDRIWLFRDGIDTGDDTLIGNGPSTGFYIAQRNLLRARVGGRTYEVGVIDRTRDDPTAFPSDTFAVAQQARIIVPSRSVDTTQQVVEVRRDLLRPLATTLQLGALRRRLTTTL